MLQGLVDGLVGVADGDVFADEGDAAGAAGLGGAADEAIPGGVADGADGEAEDFEDAGVSTEGTNYDTVLLYQERETGYEDYYREFYMFSVSNGEFLFTYETSLPTPLPNIDQYANELIAYCSPEYATNPPYPLDL